MSKIAEKVRTPKTEESKQEESVIEEEVIQELTPEEKLEKIRRLKALQSDLEALKVKEAELTKAVPEASETIDQDGLNVLESEITQGIQSATKGEQVPQISIADSAIEQEFAALEREVALEEQIVVEEKSAYEKLLEIHEWLQQAQYGFMYVMPSKKEKMDFASWREEWSQVLFDYAKVGKLHIIYIKRLLTEEPFNKFDNRKKALNSLAERLVEKDLAECVKEHGIKNTRIFLFPILTKVLLG